MKLFTLLFNIYLLALSFFPCADVESCVKTNDTFSAVIINNKEDNKDPENCTPFCICACCAVPIINQTALIEINTEQQFFSVNYASIHIHYLSQSFASIWQPPKFC